MDAAHKLTFIVRSSIYSFREIDDQWRRSTFTVRREWYGIIRIGNVYKMDDSETVKSVSEGIEFTKDEFKNHQTICDWKGLYLDKKKAK